MTEDIGRLLTVDQAAELLNVKPRFVRRLIADRRIWFTHLGSHVRIPESAVREVIRAGMVAPVTRPRIRRAA